MIKEIFVSIRMLLIMTVALGLIYPVVMTCFAQITFSDKANGSIVYKNGEIVGSKWIGQSFSQDHYFQGRPSSAGNDGYDATSSSGSNLGPTSKQELSLIDERAKAVREKNMLGSDVKVASDLVTASGSGLDPHISPAAAALQIKRVAQVRGITVADVEQLVTKYTETPQFGFLGDTRVNVLLLNLALDDKF